MNCILCFTNWTPPSLSDLTPIIFHMELTHLDLEASNYIKMPASQSEIIP